MSGKILTGSFSIKGRNGRKRDFKNVLRFRPLFFATQINGWSYPYYCIVIEEKEVLLLFFFFGEERKGSLGRPSVVQGERVVSAHRRGSVHGDFIFLSIHLQIDQASPLIKYYTLKAAKWV
jgi:hypothetical protein